MKDQQAALFEVLPTFEGAANAVEDARKVAAEAAVGDSVGGGSKGPFIFVASDTSKTRTRRSMDDSTKGVRCYHDRSVRRPQCPPEKEKKRKKGRARIRFDCTLEWRRVVSL